MPYCPKVQINEEKICNDDYHKVVFTWKSKEGSAVILSLFGTKSNGFYNYQLEYRQQYGFRDYDKDLTILKGNGCYPDGTEYDEDLIREDFEEVFNRLQII